MDVAGVLRHKVLVAMIGLPRVRLGGLQFCYGTRLWLH